MTFDIIRGIDLSLTASGIATIWKRSDGALSYNTQCVGTTGIIKLPLPQRCRELRRLKDMVLDVIGGPDLIVIEGLDASHGYGGTHERSHLWYWLVDLLVANEVPVVEVASARLKIYATGSGSASKKAVTNAVKGLWPEFGVGTNHNKADAGVLAAIGADLSGWPIPLPAQENRQVLGRLQVPEGVRPTKEEI